MFGDEQITYLKFKNSFEDIRSVQ